MIPEYFAYLTIIFSLWGIFYYLKDIIYGQTRPNIVSWIFWSIAPLVGIYISYKSGISIPLLASTFMAGFGPLLVVIFLILNRKFYSQISKFDILCGFLSFVAIIIWITTKNGILSLSFAILADLFASIPTVTKSWRENAGEHVAPYTFGIVNQLITFIIITNFAFLNFAFPIYFILINTTIILGIKKHLFKKTISLDKNLK